MLVDGNPVNFKLIHNDISTIFCESIEEVFFDVYNIKINESASLLRNKKAAFHISSEGGFIYADVEHDNTLIERVPFKIVRSVDGKTGVYINPDRLADNLNEMYITADTSVDEQMQILSESTKEEVVDLFESYQVDAEESSQLSVKNFIEDQKAGIRSLLDENLEKIKQENKDLHAELKKEIINVQANLQEGMENFITKKVKGKIDRAVSRSFEQLTENHAALLSPLLEINKNVQTQRLETNGATPDILVEKSIEGIISKTLADMRLEMSRDFKSQADIMHRDLCRKFAIYVGSYGGGGGSTQNTTIITGGGGSQTNSFTINQAAPLSISDNVRLNAGGIYEKSLADNAENSEVIGVVIDVNGNDYTIAVGGVITVPYNLNPGFIYYLSDTVPGSATFVEPTTIGHISKPLFTAINTISAVYTNMRGIDIA